MKGGKVVMTHDETFQHNRDKASQIARTASVTANLRNANRYHALSLLLSHQCPSETYEGGLQRFTFSLHCDGEVEIFATQETNGEWTVYSSGFKPEDTSWSDDDYDPEYDGKYWEN